jgi:hypothetical protein
VKDVNEKLPRYSRVRSVLWIALLAALCVEFTPGCGYALAGRGSFLPDYIRTIGIPVFSNRTPIFNLETLLTEKVRAEFIGRGKYKIVPETAGVDAVLTAEVSSATLVPISFSTQQLASRYALTLAARVELRDLRENRMLWENPSLIFRQEYEAQSGPSATDAAAFFGHDANALDRMSSDFARTIVSAILEAF